MDIGVMGLNHKRGDIHAREEMAQVCQQVFADSSPVVVLSTCNRIEIYFSGLDPTSLFRGDHYTFFGKSCFSHLCHVISGLDSALLGETEIQGQVKRAYERASTLSQLPSDLHFLFQKALKISKEVRSFGYPFQKKYAFEEKIYQLAKPMQKRVLFVGFSTLNRKVLSFFRARGVTDVTLINRSPVENPPCPSLPWENLPRWREYDVVIVATKAPHFLIEPLFSSSLIFDLSVPRNVDPLVTLKGATLYNIDQIQKKVQDIPNVTENLDLGASQSPGVRRSHLAHISNMGDDAIDQTAGAFASSQNQIFSHVRYSATCPKESLISLKNLISHQVERQWLFFEEKTNVRVRC